MSSISSQEPAPAIAGDLVTGGSEPVAYEDAPLRLFHLRVAVSASLRTRAAAGTTGIEPPRPALSASRTSGVRYQVNRTGDGSELALAVAGPAVPAGPLAWVPCRTDARRTRPGGRPRAVQRGLGRVRATRRNVMGSARSECPAPAGRRRRSCARRGRN